MQRSYLDYAMSVIVGRARPDVRDGLKPVHRKILYAMFDSGYRPDRGYVKCSRVVGDVMGQFHPHGDSAIYDSLVRMAQPWSLRYPLIDGNGNFGSPGNDPAAAMRYTECKLDPLAMEMLRDIDEDTVDFGPNYDGRAQEPAILPSRVPNLLINGADGIALGMATKSPPHNLREIAAAVQWCLANPEVDEATTLDELIGIVKGPDFPTSGLIVGTTAIQEAYRTGRGSIRMRAVVEAEEDSKGRTSLVVTELPYQVNPDNLAERVAELVKEGKLSGIADIRDESSGRTGMRLMLVLKRDAVAKVVLNNLHKHPPRQEPVGELAKIEVEIAELKEILARPERQRQIVSDELAEIVAKYGDDRRTRIIPFDGEVSMEDLIAREDVVVTITRTGYAKRTRVDLYRSQKRGGKGISGATLRQDDIVSHFFVSSTHDWILC